MASILLKERTLVAVRAGRRLKRDGIHGPGIAALMAEAGLARRHRTAAGLPSVRA